MRDIFEIACSRQKTFRLHSERVAYLCGEIAKELDVSDDFISSIAMTALFHDVGKMHIKNAILNKNDVLTIEEFEHIREHSMFGLRSVKKHLFQKDHPFSMRQRQMIETLTLTHHEQWDGLGYPLNLKGLEIPFESRICSYADIYDALRAERCYKPAMPYKETIDEMEKIIGTKLDPSLREAFLRAVIKLEERPHSRFFYISKNNIVKP